MKDHEPISPELVLVDPELRLRLRLQALRELERETSTSTEPERETSAPIALVLAAAPADAATRPTSPTSIEQRASRPSRRLMPDTRRLGSIAAVTVLVLLALVPLLAFLPPRQAPRLAGPSVEAGVMAPPKLAWAADARANYYVVQIFRKGRLVRKSVERSATATLPATLPAGEYSWRVYSGYGLVGDRVRRGPIADATFTVGGT